MILAHSATQDDDGKEIISAQLYRDHINNVVNKATSYLNELSKNFFDSEQLIDESEFQQSKEAFSLAIKIAAEYHDFGKLDNQCQKILNQEISGVKMLNHVDAGVGLMIKRYEETDNALFLFSALIIYAHHIALPNFDDLIHTNQLQYGQNTFIALIKKVKKLKTECLRDSKSCSKYGMKDTPVYKHIDRNLNKYLKIHQEEVGFICDLNCVNLKISLDNMLFDNPMFLRMGLSILVDADHTDTSKNYNNPEISNTPSLFIDRRIDKLDKYVHCLNKKVSTQSEEARNEMRKEFYEICKNYQPTSNMMLLDGSVGLGKTTAGKRLALQVAKTNPNTTRFINVTPYIALNDQVGEVFKKSIQIYPSDTEISIVHSSYEYQNKLMRRYAKELHAPVTIITSVAFFNFLIKNKVSYIKRLHKIAGSVIFLDEYDRCAQSKHWKVLMNIFSDLARFFNVKIIFSSGTPIEYWNIDEIANEKGSFNSYNSSEIFMKDICIDRVIPNDFREKMLKFESQRVKFVDLKQIDYKDLVSKIVNTKGSLICIMDTVRRCNELFERLNKSDRRKLFMRHAGLTPKDRKKHIKIIKEHMDKNEDIILISTPGGNVGLDLSFHAGFQDNTGIKDLMQTSGRISRNFEFEGACLYLFDLNVDQNENGINFKFYNNRNSNKSRTKLREYCDNQPGQEIFILPSQCTLFTQLEFDHDDAVNDDLLTSLEKYRDFYQDKNYEELSHNMNIIESPCIHVLVDDEMHHKILDQEYFSYARLQENIVNIVDYSRDRLQRLLDANKIISIEEELAEKYNIELEALNSSEIRVNSGLYFWIGDYDENHKGVYAEGVLN